MSSLSSLLAPLKGPLNLSDVLPGEPTVTVASRPSAPEPPVRSKPRPAPDLGTTKSPSPAPAQYSDDDEDEENDPVLALIAEGDTIDTPPPRLAPRTPEPTRNPSKKGSGSSSKGTGKRSRSSSVDESKSKVKREFHSSESEDSSLGKKGSKRSKKKQSKSGSKTPVDVLNLREETRQLHIISSNPGNIALLPDTWASHFRGFPIPNGLFYRKTREASSWPRIYEHTDGQDYHVQSRIRDIRNEYMEVQHDLEKDHDDKAEDAKKFRARYIKTLKPALEKAVNWAWVDGDLPRFPTPETITVFAVAKLHNQAAAIAEIRAKMHAMAARWRELMMDEMNAAIKDDPSITEKYPKAPVIYGFAIMEHNVIVVHLDASDENAEPFFQINLDMDTNNQRQWFALMIMVIVCFARDKAMALMGQMKLEPQSESEESDPDA
ncbi:hypothetical protein E8E14_003506 [Neopestalotiopsis sp. 37M]|nr:hypothetical protein E8E14_003506 [Neopestalotiopsis sp. 37M]